MRLFLALVAVTGVHALRSLPACRGAPMARLQPPRLRSTAAYANALAAGGGGNEMTMEKAHDYFNIVATSAVATLTTMCHFVTPLWNTPLVRVMCAYLVIDSVWLILRPEIAGGTEGGGALTLLGHHAAALLISLHAATWPLHLHYTAHMAVVEMNTLILMLERTVPGGPLVTGTLHKLFVASWVLTRLMWFPFLALRLSIMGGYPSVGRQLVCAGCLLLLTTLQFVWTWNFLVPERQVPLL